MRNWLRTLLFISAFSPALLTLAYVRFGAVGWRTDVLQLVVIGVIGSLLPLAIASLIAKQAETIGIQAKKIESNDIVLLGFVVSYLVPLVGKGADMSVDAIALLLLGIGGLMWLITSLPAHPLLRVLRFRFYKLESSTGMVYTLISKREIRDPREVKAVKKISESMLMEAGDA
jgi:hypothetical protein